MKLKQKILLALAGISLMLTALPLTASAQIPCDSTTLTPKQAIQCGECGAAGQPSCDTKPTTTLDDTVKTIINLLSIIAGIAAIIMIIVAGLRYITSGGDADKVKSAKNTLIYALIGLILVVLAQTIVHFVFTETTNPSTSAKAANNPSAIATSQYVQEAPAGRNSAVGQAA